jgi:deaminated glutathione amidase
MVCSVDIIQHRHLTLPTVMSDPIAYGIVSTAAAPMGRLGVAQMTSIDNVDKNFAVVERIVKRAAAQHVNLLSLPECFAYMGRAQGDAARNAAEPLDGPLLERYRAIAREYSIWLSLGGFHEQQAGGRVSNTHVLLDACGATRALYRKAHLFDVAAGGGDDGFRESDTTDAGAFAGAVCFGTPVGCVGLTVCYDLRFPEVFGALRRAGADVILVPSAFMRGTGAAHWEVLLRARAIETQCYVGAAAQVGEHFPGGRASFGRALIADCWGTVLENAGEVRDGVVVSADVDTEIVASVRKRMPVSEHRRPELYRDAGIEVFGKQ